MNAAIEWLNKKYKTKCTHDWDYTGHGHNSDFYSKVPDKAVRFMSPELPKGEYTLKIEVTGIVPEWFQKNGTRFGSSDCYVNINDIVVF